jgi:hypothetical protein
MQRNLYMTEVALYDRPALEVVTFTTHFGKFGLMTCFDALFQHPFIDLIETEGIITHLRLKNLVLKKNYSTRCKTWFMRCPGRPE